MATTDTPQTTPLEALQFLDSVLSKIGGSRQDHVNIQGSIGTIAKALNDHLGCVQQPAAPAPVAPIAPSFPTAEELAPASPSPAPIL